MNDDHKNWKNKGKKLVKKNMPLECEDGGGILP